MEDAQSNANDDYKFNYSCRVLREGLLDMARVDASREGDGQRTYLLWKHDFVTFAATGHSNYAALAFRLIAQVEVILSKQKATQLLNNRTVNMHGGQGRNVPLDYAVELLNGEVKPDLRHRYGTLTSDTIKRVGKSLKPCQEIVKNVDIQLENFTAIGRHKEMFFEDEINLMVKELHKEKLFDKIPGRKHKSFPNIGIARKVNSNKLEQWLQKQIKNLKIEQEMKRLTKDL